MVTNGRKMLDTEHFLCVFLQWEISLPNECEPIFNAMLLMQCNLLISFSEPLNIVSPILKTVNARKKSPVKMYCKATGIPTPKILWSFRNKGKHTVFIF